MNSIFEQLADWKDFERLCADLLEAESFIIESEPFVDRMGADIVATEVFKAHNDPSRHREIRWRVQCKHYAGSGNKLGRAEVEEALNSYGAYRGHDDGLLIIVDTDYTEPAQQVIDRYRSVHPDAFIWIWNQRQLLTRLERHPHLLRRYNLPLLKVDFLSILGSIKSLGPVRTLFISDQSATAHDLTSVLRAAGFEITFLPFWNYLDETRMEIYEATVLADEFSLIVCLLGDSFTLPLPAKLLKVIERCYKAGTSLLVFPFLAWSINRGLYSPLRDIIPVELEDPKKIPLALKVKRVTSSYRNDDLSWLLAYDSFAENQYVEIDPKDGKSQFTRGIDTRFGLAHSFEYLTIKRNAELIWADTTGNPLIVVSETDRSKVCYLNTCTHSCLSSIVISSPFEVTPQFSQLMSNVLTWLLE
jgi:hypothetical protein